MDFCILIITHWVESTFILLSFINQRHKMLHLRQQLMSFLFIDGELVLCLLIVSLIFIRWFYNLIHIILSALYSYMLWAMFYPDSFWLCIETVLDVLHRPPRFQYEAYGYRNPRWIADESKIFKRRFLPYCKSQYHNIWSVNKPGIFLLTPPPPPVRYRKHSDKIYKYKFWTFQISLVMFRSFSKAETKYSVLNLKTKSEIYATHLIKQVGINIKRWSYITSNINDISQANPDMSQTT